MSDPDAVVVGAGPNGLAAAIALARAGYAVRVLEAAQSPGGGARSAALTLPGFLHDTCSAIHAFAAASPFFQSLSLDRYGLEWVRPPIMLAHPFDETRASTLEATVAETAARLDADAGAYAALIGPLVDAWDDIASTAVSGSMWHWPARPLELARIGWWASRSASHLLSRFREVRSRALLAGVAAHGMRPLDGSLTGGFALALSACAHVTGWVFPRGGAQRLTDALVNCLVACGGTIDTGVRVDSIDDLPRARLVLCDLSPAPFLRIASHRLPAGFRRALGNYRYGTAAYKVDWALDAPIPWTDPICLGAGTVHVGGTAEEVIDAERRTAAGTPVDRPFVLLTQPTLFDPSRAPAGRHVAWAYCHVPNGSRADMWPRIEEQIERFAPGFRDRILARAVRGPAAIERDNPNFVGGDIASGVVDWRQLITRPTRHVYATPIRGVYLCSAATPPGIGVHGMCGYFAARRAMADDARGRAGFEPARESARISGSGVAVVD